MLPIEPVTQMNYGNLGMFYVSTLRWQSLEFTATNRYACYDAANNETLPAETTILVIGKFVVQLIFIHRINICCISRH